METYIHVPQRLCRLLHSLKYKIDLIPSVYTHTHMKSSKDLPVAISIAGSDSGGGAGIQADLKTFHAHGCFGTTAITAITCQNTEGVSAVQSIKPDIIAGQIKSVLSDFPVQAAKTGMLFSAEIIEAVQFSLKNIEFPLIIDPVMVATSGDRLLEKSAEEALIRFLKMATLITPNLPEAEVILDRKIKSIDEMKHALPELFEKTRANILLKGGHLQKERDYQKAETLLNGKEPLKDEHPSESEVTDFYFDGEKVHTFTSPRLESRNTHGTGCTLSAAIAARMAQNDSPLEAIKKSRDYLHGAIENAPDLGQGPAGPLNHMWRE